MDELLSIDKRRHELLIVSRNGNSNASELLMRRMLRYEVIISEICRGQTYRSRVSGPLMDRIDIHIEVPAIKFKEISSDKPAEESAFLQPLYLIDSES